jgi:hypothetical protein
MTAFLTFLYIILGMCWASYTECYEAHQKNVSVFNWLMSAMFWPIELSITVLLWFMYHNNNKG